MTEENMYPSGSGLNEFIKAVTKTALRDPYAEPLDELESAINRALYKGAPRGQDPKAS